MQGIGNFGIREEENLNWAEIEEKKEEIAQQKNSEA